MTAIILACAGPSLPNLVELPEGSPPIAAVSTAIQACGSVADYWIMVDSPHPPNQGRNKNYGPDGGYCWLESPWLIKVMPDRKKMRQQYSHKPAKYPNVEIWGYNGSSKLDEKMVKQGRRLFDGRQPFFRTCHMALPFAIQWAIVGGCFTKIILAGVDLKTTLDQPRKWGKFDAMCGGDMTEKMVEDQNRKHGLVFDVLKEMVRRAPTIPTGPVEFVSWSPGSRINELMRYEECPIPCLKS